MAFWGIVGSWYVIGVVRDESKRIKFIAVLSYLRKYTAVLCQTVILSEMFLKWETIKNTGILPVSFYLPRNLSFFYKRKKIFFPNSNLKFSFHIFVELVQF